MHATAQGDQQEQLVRHIDSLVDTSIMEDIDMVLSMEPSEEADSLCALEVEEGTTYACQD